jgi:hypothetical protein
MHHGYPTRTRIEAHLKELLLQEQDALLRLCDSDLTPLLRRQLHQLILRIRAEKTGLEESLGVIDSNL